MHFGNDSRWWTIDKRYRFFFYFAYTQAESQRIAVLVKNPRGKILHLCILIPQSEYIRTCHWETILRFHDFKITVMTQYQK